MMKRHFSLFIYRSNQRYFNSAGRRLIVFLILILGLNNAEASPPNASSTGKASAPDYHLDPNLDRAKLLTSNIEASRIAYEQGVTYMREGIHVTALEYFQTSQALDPHPLTQLMMAAIESGMGHYTRAYKLLKQALNASKKLTAEQLETATELMHSVRSRMGEIQLSVSAPTFWVLVDGRPIEPEPLEGDAASAGISPKWLAATAYSGQGRGISRGRADILVDVGLHRIEVSADGFSKEGGYYTEVRERSVQASETVLLHIEFRRTFWRKASVGLMFAGGAGVALGSGLFLAAYVEKDAARNQCSSAWVCTRAGVKHIDNAKVLADITTVLIPTSALVGATGVINWLAASRMQSSNELRSFASNFHPSLRIGRHESMAFVSGSF